MNAILGTLSAWQGNSIVVGGLLIVLLLLAFRGSKIFLWSPVVLLELLLIGAEGTSLGVCAGILFVLNVSPLRAYLVSFPLMKILQSLNMLPAISETEKTALEAGATWVDGELFSGKPNFSDINKELYGRLTTEEQDFLNGPVEELCRMLDDWQIHQERDLPESVWTFLKKHKFFGMIISKEDGGLGFSALAHSEVIQKISSQSIPVAVTVMVPNSLGPAELIGHYGTPEQKRHYLPRLAVGEEMPCFALTEPEAGSDAGSLTSSGEVFKGEDGKLYVKLNWEKRYITLAAISTVIGLAVRIRDPEDLLGKGVEPGITCVLVPASTKGVVLGMRHDPMGVPFYNCPTKGNDVVIPIEQVIGGADGVGRGWTMLMECLAAGRSISLPALSTAGVKGTARVTSAYTVVRRQFGISIGKFEGIEEKIAKILGIAYLIEGARVFTASAVDQGIKPAVISAVAKFACTELNRELINDGMDIVGGAGICLGPRNLLAHGYMATPIAITVEGANILTRTMIIFGQGAIRCHPFVYKELNALLESDLTQFDKAFWGHIGFVFRNATRSVLLSLTRGRMASTPGGYGKKYYRKLAWTSATFALFADLALGLLGGKLKFKEKLTGRYADVLIWMYLATASLRRFEANGCKKEDRAALDWSCQYALYQCQLAFESLFENFDVPILGSILKGPVSWWNRLNRFCAAPSDDLGKKLVTQALQPGEFRDSLTSGIYISDDVAMQSGRLEHAFQLACKADVIYKKIKVAQAKRKLPRGRKPERLVTQALEAGVISAEEQEIIQQAEVARRDAIQVDAFTLDQYKETAKKQAA